MNSDCERLKQQLSDTQNEKKTIDNKRASVAADNDKLKADLDKIKGFNVELQRQKDNLDDENVSSLIFLCLACTCYPYYC